MTNARTQEEAYAHNRFWALVLVPLGCLVAILQLVFYLGIGLAAVLYLVSLVR